MAKNYIKGDSYRLYLNTGTYGTPVNTQIKGVTDLAFDPAPSDIVIQESGISDGHLQGFGDPKFSFTLYEDTGDTSGGVALLTAAIAGTMKELFLANGDIATTGTKYWRMESLVTSYPHSPARGQGSSFAVEAHRHANSDYDFSRATAA